ncbi:MAG: hypothetical protein ACWA41_07535 [Putridiphycobacter sp.]
MNKFHLTLLTLVASFALHAGGFKFPNQSYSYAEFHLFNTHYEGGKPDLYIYKDGVYAQSKFGNGKLLSSQFLKKIESVFNLGIDEIWMGLSKCTIPRHGIIFYNESNQPVASVSICFECQQVNFWSSKPLNVKTDYDNLDLEKAEKQIKDLKRIVKSEGIKVFDDSQKYKSYIDQDMNLKNQGKMELKDISLDSIFGHKFQIEDLKKWSVNQFIHFKKESVEKMTMSDSFYFDEYKSSQKNDYTRFVMSGTEQDAYLIQAEIFNPAIKLPNQMQIGMSSDDVLGHYPIPTREMPEYPQKFTVYGEHSKLEYFFKNQTLVKMVLYVWVN